MNCRSPIWWLALCTWVVTLAACNIGVQPPSATSPVPLATPSIPATEAPTGSPAPSPTFASLTPTQQPGPTLDIRVPFCDIHVTGYLKLDLQPCTPPSYTNAGDLLGGDYLMLVTLVNYDLVGVQITVPRNWLLKLRPGKYVLGDGDDAKYSSALNAAFGYAPADAPEDARDPDAYWYYSYPGGKVTFTETDQYAAGSFDFGARNHKGRQINVVGTFMDVPFTHVYPP